MTIRRDVLRRAAALVLAGRAVARSAVAAAARPAAPGPAPDSQTVLRALEDAFVSVADRVTPVGRQRQRQAQAGPRRRASRAGEGGALPRVLRPGVLRALLPPARAARGRRAAGLGRHRGCARLHPDQQPRGRERDRDRGAPLRRPEVQGHPRRPRPQAPTSRCSRSSAGRRRCRSPSSATPTSCGSGSGRSPSATRSASTGP